MALGYFYFASHERKQYWRSLVALTAAALWPPACLPALLACIACLSECLWRWKKLSESPQRASELPAPPPLRCTAEDRGHSAETSAKGGRTLAKVGHAINGTTFRDLSHAQTNNADAGTLLSKECSDFRCPLSSPRAVTDLVTEPVSRILPHTSYLTVGMVVIR